MGGLIRQAYAAFSVSLFVTSCGMAYSWVSPVLTELKDPQGAIRATSGQVSWIVVFIEFGTLVTPFLASYWMDRFGRKLPLLLCIPAAILSWSLIILTRSVTLLYIKRVIDGLIIGLEATIAPIYLAEVSNANIRGAILISILVSWNLGSVLQFFIGTFFSYNTAGWVNMAVLILFSIVFSFLPESPYYLVMKREDAKAASSLAWFQGVHPNHISEELKIIKEYVEKDLENKESLKDAWKNVAYRKAFGTIIVISLAGSLTGATAIFSYATEMFAGTGSGGFLNADTCSLMVVILFLVTSVIISCLIDRLGRRPLVLISGFGCFFSHLGSAYYFYFKNDISYNWIPLVTIGSYCFFFSVGIFPVQTAFQGELFPPSIKSSASGIYVVFNTFLSICVVKLYYIINATYGMYLNYIFYAFVAITCTILLYFNAPETKNKTFSELYDEFNKIGGNSIVHEELQSLKRGT